jgi:hypothetical protein
MMGQVYALTEYRRRARNRDLGRLVDAVRLRSPEVEECLKDLLQHNADGMPLNISVMSSELPHRQSILLGAGYPRAVLEPHNGDVQPWFMGLELRYFTRSQIQAMDLVGQKTVEFEDSYELLNMHGYLEGLISDPDELLSPWFNTAFTLMANLIHVYDFTVVSVGTDTRGVLRVRMFIDTHVIDMDLDGPSLQHCFKTVKPPVVQR